MIYIFLPDIFLLVTRQKYNEYVLCLKRNDADEDVCKKQKAFAYSICPDDWVRTNTTFSTSLCPRLQ